jgi:multiple sugar transport system substrate-binding protein
MEVTGFWNISSLKDSDLNWDIAPLWHGKVNAVPAFSSALAVSASSNNKEAAAKLLVFLTSAAGQQPIATSGLDVPSNLAAVADPTFQQPDWNTAGVDLSAFTSAAADVYAPPFVPQWNEIQKAFTDGLADTYTNKQSVKDGLDKVQATLESLLK